MKFSPSRFLVLAFSVLALAVALPARAQWIQGPVCQSAWTTNTEVFMVPGLFTTNVPTSMARAFGVGRTGVGFGAVVAGTNAATTTNCIFTFELSANATDYFVNNRLTAGIAPTGTGYAPFYTNWVLTTPALDNTILIRLRSIQNTNVDAIFITNTCLNTR